MITGVHGAGHDRAAAGGNQIIARRACRCWRWRGSRRGRAGVEIPAGVGDDPGKLAAGVVVEIAEVAADAHSSSLVSHHDRAVVPCACLCRSAGQRRIRTEERGQGSHVVAQRREGAGAQRASGVVGGGVVIERRVVGCPRATERKAAAEPVVVRCYHNPTASYVCIEVVAKCSLVSPEAVGEGQHNLVLLQLGQSGRAAAIEEICAYDAGFGEQTSSQITFVVAAVGRYHEHPKLAWLGRRLNRVSIFENVQPAHNQKAVPDRCAVCPRMRHICSRSGGPGIRGYVINVCRSRGLVATDKVRLVANGARGRLELASRARRQDFPGIR